MGVGIFDAKRRETIFKSHDQTMIPKVNVCTQVRATMTDDGFAILDGQEDINKLLPKTLVMNDGLDIIERKTTENKPQLVDLTIVVACQHYCISSVRPFEDEEQGATSVKEAPQEQAILSKKDQRKLRKRLAKAVGVVD